MLLLQEIISVLLTGAEFHPLFFYIKYLNRASAPAPVAL